MKKLGKLAKRMSMAIAVATLVATTLPATEVVYASPQENVLQVKAPPSGHKPPRNDGRAGRNSNEQRPNRGEIRHENHRGEHRPPRHEEPRGHHRPPKHDNHHGGPRRGHRPPAPPPRPHNHWYNHAYAIAVAKHDGYKDGYEGYRYGAHKKYWLHGPVRATYEYYYDMYYQMGRAEREGYYY